MIRPTRSLLVALVAAPLFTAACTTDFDRFLGSGGGGTGGGTTTVTTTTSAGGAGGMGQGGGGGADPCDGVDCNDNEPCTEDNCSDGVCSHPADTTPTLTQVVGDCQILACAGTPSATVSNDDDTDEPGSDSNECTKDECLAGVPYPPEDTTVVCNTNGVCDGAGSCSACNTAADCGANPPCGTRTCTGNPLACGVTPTGAGTFVSTDGTNGNCMANVCNGTSDQSVLGAYNLDLPADVNNDCHSPSCTAGTPGQATIDNADLPLNVANDCRSPSCSAGTPGQATVNNADLPLNIANDCKAPACNAGNPTTTNDNADLPMDVANDCKDPACSGGNPTTTNQALGSACDDLTAEAAGQCMAGTCMDCTANGAPGCNVGNSCNVNTCCVPMTMIVACAGKECGSVSDGCGGMITCTNTCATAPKGDGCINNLCGCADATDCQNAGADGDDCNAGACGCNNDNDCPISDRGERCPSAPTIGACGCNTAGTASADCNNSERGLACLAALVCGCTVATDCTGVGNGTCNVGTGICNP